jgi:hypothetical protein
MLNEQSATGQFASQEKNNDHFQAESSSHQKRYKFLQTETESVDGGIQADEHDDKDKEHHDAADVENDLRDEEKFRAKLQEDAGSGEERSDEKNGAMNGVAARDHQGGAENGDTGEEVEKDAIQHRNP